MMTDLTSLTMTEALAGMAKGEFTSVELTEAHVRAVEASRPLNAFITETPDQALAMAERADTKRAKGEAGPMAGPPPAATSWKASSRRTNRPSPPTCGAMAPSCWAR